jgi:hypothetical protein
VPVSTPATTSGAYSFDVDADVVAEDTNIHQPQDLGISLAKVSCA